MRSASLAAFLSLVLSLVPSGTASAFSWAKVGDPVNPPDTRPLATQQVGEGGWPPEFDERGSVPYTFWILNSAVSVADWVDYVNSVGESADTVHPRMFEPTLIAPQILDYDAQGNVIPFPGSEALPILYINLEQAKRYANWWHNGRPDDPNALLDGAYDCTSFPCSIREAGALFAIPSMDELHKASYYDPTTQTYFMYPNSGDVPTVGPPPGDGTTFNASGTTAGTCCNCTPDPDAVCDWVPLQQYWTFSPYLVRDLCGSGFVMTDTNGPERFVGGPALDTWGVIHGVSPLHTTLDCRAISVHLSPVDDTAFAFRPVFLVRFDSPTPRTCGLGAELALVLPLIWRLRSRRRGRS